MDIDDWTKAIEDGFAAGQRGDDPRLNPWPKLTHPWQTWNRWHAYGVAIGGKHGEEDRDAGAAGGDGAGSVR